MVAKGVQEKNIIFLNVVSCPEGIRRLNQEYPEGKGFKFSRKALNFHGNMREIFIWNRQSKNSHRPNWFTFEWFKIYRTWSWRLWRSIFWFNLKASWKSESLDFRKDELLSRRSIVRIIIFFYCSRIIVILLQ